MKYEKVTPRGLITDEMLTNVWCPTLKQKMGLDDLTDVVYTKGGNKKDNVYMIRYYQLSKIIPICFSDI